MISNGVSDCRQDLVRWFCYWCRQSAAPGLKLNVLLGFVDRVCAEMQRMEAINQRVDVGLSVNRVTV